MAGNVMAAGSCDGSGAGALGPAARLQAEREAKDLANHADRVKWLTGHEPKWADGVPVDAHSCHALLQQSRAALAAARPTPSDEERAMPMATSPIHFDYALRSADDCERRLHYQLLPSGVIVESMDSGWTPGEPEQQTAEATLEVEYFPGGRVETFVLGGDQHRELEDGGVFDDFLREIGGGRTPQDALEHTLHSMSEAPGLA